MKKNAKLTRIFAHFLIAGFVLTGCAAPSSDATETPDPVAAAQSSEVTSEPSLMSFDQPMEERNPAQQFAAGVLAVPLIALYVVILPFAL